MIFLNKNYCLSSPVISGDVRQVAAPPRPETAWERGLRQAKEMKRLSQQRKETDVEYEEKRTAMSLTQAELVSSFKFAFTHYIQLKADVFYDN